MLKRIIIFMLCAGLIGMIIGAGGCGGGKSSEKKESADTSRAVAAPTEKPTEKPVEEPTPKPTPKPTKRPVETVDAKVVEIIDGDTIKVQIGTATETVQFIGANAPELDPSKESECFAKEAAEHARQFLINKTVKLEKDENLQDRDEHGNLLRYVWFADKKTLFNEIALEFGYAILSTEKSYVYQAEFEQAQKWAEQDQKGLWHPDTCGGKLQPRGKYDCSSDVYNCGDFKTQAEAQAAFDACFPSAGDVHGLDRDGNKKACESLP